MAEKGQVIGANSAENTVVVKMTRTEACAKCRACIAGMKKEDMLIHAENLCDAKVGDWVEMDIHGNGFINAVLIMYGIPFLSFIAGIVIAHFLITPHLNIGKYNEIITFLFGVIGIVLASLWIRSKEDVWKTKKYRPVAISITTPDEIQLQYQQQDEN